MGVGGQRHAPTEITPGKDSVPIVQEAGWAPGPVWTSTENLAPTRIRFPDRPARSDSLYWLRYPGPHSFVIAYINIRYLFQTHINKYIHIGQ